MMMMEAMAMPREAAGWCAAGAAAATTLAFCYVGRPSVVSTEAGRPPVVSTGQQPRPTQRRAHAKGPGPTRQSAGPSWARRSRRRRSKPKLLGSTRPRYAADHSRHPQVARVQTEELPAERTGSAADPPQPKQATPVQIVLTENPAERAVLDVPDEHTQVLVETVATEHLIECTEQSVDTPRTERKKKMHAAFASLNTQMAEESESLPGSFEEDIANAEETNSCSEEATIKRLDVSRMSEADENDDDEDSVQRLLQYRAKRSSRGGSPARELRQLMRSRSASRSPTHERGVASPAGVHTEASKQIGIDCGGGGDDDADDAHNIAMIGNRLRTKPSGAKPLSLSRPAVAADSHQQRRAGQIMAEILQAETLLARFRPSGEVEPQLREARHLRDRLRTLRHELQVGNNSTSTHHAKVLQEGIIKRLRKVFSEIRQLLLTAAREQIETGTPAEEGQAQHNDGDPPSPVDDHATTSPQPSPQLGGEFDFLGSTLKAELKDALKAPISRPDVTGDAATTVDEVATNMSPVRTESDDRCASSPQSERPRSPAMRTSPGVVRSIDLDPSSPEDEHGDSEAMSKLSPPEGLAHGLVLPPAYDSPARAYGRKKRGQLPAANAMGVSPPAITPPPAWNPAKGQEQDTAIEPAPQLELLGPRLGQNNPAPGSTIEMNGGQNLEDSDHNRTSSTASGSRLHGTGTERVALGEISCNSSASSLRRADQQVQSTRTPNATVDTRKSHEIGEVSACSQRNTSADISVESLIEMFGSANISTKSTTEESTTDEGEEESGDQQESPPVYSRNRPIPSPGLYRIAATPVGWSALLTAIENVDRSALKARQQTPPEERKRRSQRDVNPLHDALTATLAKINRVNRSDSESEASSRSPSISGSGNKMEMRRSLRSDWSSSDSATPSPVVAISPGKTHLAV